jgi:hypothetical protein
MSVSISNSTGANPSAIWSGASMAQSPSQKMSSLFDQIDSSGSGTITKAQFEQAFKTLNTSANFQVQGADAVWAKLDPNKTGSVSKQNFVKSMATQMKALRGYGHNHKHAQPANANSATQTVDQSLTALSGLGSDSSTVGTVINKVV